MMTASLFVWRCWFSSRLETDPIEYK